jgi:hypothetical protein
LLQIFASQAVTPNGPVTIPVSADQFARLEERRAGGEPDFTARLEALVQREAPAGIDRRPTLQCGLYAHLHDGKASRVPRRLGADVRGPPGTPASRPLG